jgi:tRNA pseudouridine55 synthase
VSDGFLVIDKPSGPTSHDVVAAVRRATGSKKAGHAGTLDPMATGAVVVALGRSTRLIRYIQDQEKEYLAVARFGVATDTLDAEGEVVHEEVMDFDRSQFEAILPEFLGVIQQVPPMVSALKRDGVRLYELARQGIEVERPPRPVEILELELTSFEPGEHPLVGLRVVCGKGTYVRSLADDLAVRLGGRAHLIALRRTRVGALAIEELGIGLDQLSDWERHLITPIAGLAHLPSVTVAERARVLSGRPIEAPAGPAGPPVFRVVDTDGVLLAVYRTDGARAVPEVVLS